MAELPETILQFGSGRFLRGFVDLFAHQANQGEHPVGRVVIVQSTEGERARQLTANGCRYHVLIRGLQDGNAVDETIEVQSVSRALVAAEEWEEIADVACSEDLRLIVSNTTEMGLNLLPQDDDREGNSPLSFPARLTELLNLRYESGLPGLTILPCELIENNADLLLRRTQEQALRWGWEGRFTYWLETECRWLNTLVDRIVTERPEGHPLLAQDPLLTVAEPFALWAIEGSGQEPYVFEHPAILRSLDVGRYWLRKVRILNGAHSALVTRALPMGYVTVREAMADPLLAAWLHDLLFTEIVPTLAGRVDDAEKFAHQTLERFANPFLNHQLRDIAVNQTQKVAIRLRPTAEEYTAQFGKPPRLLSAILAET
ncbi:MAG: Mannitol-phosphate/altronate dehydrogenase [Chthonomonadales bacterium]|nr:Mannitol-phosphate/altronate dehydrogenase [Chthonomonadales bacterium]